jgi:hypothetical protein
METGEESKLTRGVLAVTSAVILAIAAVPAPLAAQARDSAVVVDVQYQADSAFTLVLQAFAEAAIEIAVASADQGLVLSTTEKMGRESQIAYARYQAQLIAMGPITQVTLSGLLSPTETLERSVTVTSGSFFHGALVWARLQWVGRELRKSVPEASER